MPSKRITVPTVEYLKTDKVQEDFWDTLTPGFGVRVTKGGRKTFVVMTRVLVAGQWKKRRYTIGRYAEGVDHEDQGLDLKTARDRAKAVIAAAGDGRDPQEVLQPSPRDEMVERSANCFANVREDFLKRYRTRQKTKPRPRTIEEMRRCISGKRFKNWNDKPVTAITKRDVRNLLDAIMDEGHDAHANKTLTVLKMLFNWAYDHEKINDIPTERMKPPGAVTPRERTLTSPEMVTIWNATYGDEATDSHIHGDIVRILMLTGQRRNEVAGMQWSEIDFDRRTWELPRDRTKNKQPHIVPLSSAVLSILRRQLKEQKELGLESAYVFTTTGETPFSGWSRSKKRLDQRCGVTDWRLHDLRRTVVTGMNDDLGVWPHVVEAVVNHVTGAAKRGVAGVYNRAEYLKERRRALERWARHLLKQVAEARRAA